MQKITTFLWFDDNAEEAARFYTSIFKNSSIDEVMRYSDSVSRPAGSIATVSFTLDGEEYIALNGGPNYRFTPAISLFVRCDSQDEIDELWEKLVAGGEPVACGWLKDRYGLSWQITPSNLLSMLQDKDTLRASRVMQAMRQMIKLDSAALRRAYEGDRA